ncbi:hypothetical protein PBAL39_00512 [Pedobacter sp. BAL39]|uniref:hypothetical protein n=1 Tax=Pedobacter sp. BAL39 TaxID=391596 RepID=UPI0001559A88|nr:hypothetical protein [Pedobacter sp. BAL39]EDM38051.1 hypothetical protein PBAL39_00512 [Pedobacter sp. BAL39]
MFTFIPMAGINKFQISEDEKSIKWRFDIQEVKLNFNNRIFQAVLLENKQQILVITDINESGRDNLFFYAADGSLFARPELLNAPEKIIGAYAIWYLEHQEEQTLILLPEHRRDYDIKCLFNMNTLKCSDFSITR